MIELQEVTKKFGKHQIFDRYSLSISAEKMTAILGRSGFGTGLHSGEKSTTDKQ